MRLTKPNIKLLPVLIILVLLTVVYLLTRSMNNNLYIPAFKGQVQDLTALKGEDLTGYLKTLEIGQVAKINFSLPEKKQLWAGSPESGQVFSAMQLEEVPDLMLLVLSSTEGKPQIRFLEDALPAAGDKYVKLIARQTEQTTDSQPEANQPDPYVTTRENFQRVYNLTIKPTFTFQLVHFSADDQVIKINGRDSNDLAYIIVIGMVVFLSYFISLWYKTRTERVSLRRKKRVTG